MTDASISPSVIIIGAGPAGLFAAETLAQAGCRVTVYEQKPSAARKFLMAGRGGLNITHSENLVDFIARYDVPATVATWIAGFTPDDMRAWCDGLGADTFVGSSGRVFPRAMKASPLLRAWQARLYDLGVRIQFNRRFAGHAADGAVMIVHDDGFAETVTADAVILATGGASWPKLGSDGAWAEAVRPHGVALAPFVASNCGFTVAWSAYFQDKHAGTPLKPVVIGVGSRRVRGEVMLSHYGIEGGAVYAVSRDIQDELTRAGQVEITLDMTPDVTEDALRGKLARARGTQSLASHLRRTAGLSPAAIALLHEGGHDPRSMDAAQLAAHIKAVRVRVTGDAGLSRAISSRGGVKLDAVTDDLMLKAMPGVFAAGEMLDWDAPTGGYLLQASFASGRHAARGVLKYLHRT